MDKEAEERAHERSPESSSAGPSVGDAMDVEGKEGTTVEGENVGGAAGKEEAGEKKDAGDAAHDPPAAGKRERGEEQSAMDVERSAAEAGPGGGNMSTKGGQRGQGERDGGSTAEVGTNSTEKGGASTRSSVRSKMEESATETKQGASSTKQSGRDGAKENEPRPSKEGENGEQGKHSHSKLASDKAEWKEAVEEAVYFNRSIHIERMLRGPYHFDAHTQTIQVASSWVVPGVRQMSEEEQEKHRAKWINDIKTHVLIKGGRDVILSDRRSLSAPKMVEQARMLVQQQQEPEKKKESKWKRRKRRERERKEQREREKRKEREREREKEKEKEEQKKEREARRAAAKRSFPDFEQVIPDDADLEGVSSAAEPSAAAEDSGGDRMDVEEGDSAKGERKESKSKGSSKRVTKSEQADDEAEAQSEGEWDDSACAICHSQCAKVSPDALQCSQCARHYHAVQCLELNDVTLKRIRELERGIDRRPRAAAFADEKEDSKSAEPNPEAAVKWTCTDCKICFICNEPKNDDKLLFCDCCDRGYHTYCLRQPLSKPPPGAWICDACVHCISCGSTSPGMFANSKWREEYTLCEACYKAKQQKRFCTFCDRICEPRSDGAVRCTSCKTFVHMECNKKEEEKHGRGDGNDGGGRASAFVCYSCVHEAKGEAKESKEVGKRGVGEGEEAEEAELGKRKRETDESPLPEGRELRKRRRRG